MKWRNRRLVWSFLTIGVLAFAFSSVALAETRTLTQETKLYPQGWSVGEELKFKKGSSVETNAMGEVISGVLASDTFLRPHGWKNVINDYYYATAYSDIRPFFFRYPFVERRYNIAIPAYGHLRYKGGSAVVFSAQGDVLEGIIDEDATILLNEERYGFVTFKKGFVLKFDDSTGTLKEGTLAADTNLRPIGWQNNLGENKEQAGFLKFKSKSRVAFTEDGLVVLGTIKEKTTWQQPDGSVVELEAGKEVTFSETGRVVSN
ncbi:MAG TPA: hypothetical protein IAB06_07030 [Candidatus Avacidaminococcus intestinavium]|uniref:Uncharacterized protein n=1 Tax=Candidatus Avacidaminococcus intestinavium TaxID=2840684 RepID=A0A9D1MRB4_9FIRM|nr:hypothetical protein [Candidatus Avacidaminococcus intestinavium]